MGLIAMEYGAPNEDDERELEEWVFWTRRAQGLPDRIEDAAVLARVAGLLKATESTSELHLGHEELPIVPQRRRQRGSSNLGLSP